MRIFVTGTDTGVGKTYCTVAVIRALRAQGVPAIGLKPVSCGSREDARLLYEAAGGALPLDELNPFHFDAPLAPAVAGGSRAPRIGPLMDWFRRVGAAADPVLVEGAGGWLTPLCTGHTMADFAAELGLPVLIVTANRLGCLNHSLLTLENVLARKLPCLGFLLNEAAPDPFDESRMSNAPALEAASGYPVLGKLMHGSVELPPPFLRKLAQRAAPGGVSSGI